MIIGSTKRDGLIAGDYPLVAKEITITGPAQFKRGDVIGATTEGDYALADSNATDGSQNAIGIITDDTNAEDGISIVTTMYVKGEFNQRQLRFGGKDTVENHRRRMTEIGLLIRETRI